MGNTERKPPDSVILQGEPSRWFSGNLAGINAGVIFTPWDQVGGLFSLCSYSHPNSSGIQAGVYAKIDTQKTKKRKSCGEPENVSVLITLLRTRSYSRRLVVWCVTAKGGGTR